jgi:hypothetical protein
LRPLTDAPAVVAFDPQWCLFWPHHVRATQLDIWAPYLRASRHRFVVMASADGFPDRVRAAIDTMDHCAILEPYAQGIDWLTAAPGLQGFLYVGSYDDNAAVMDTHPNATHVWVGHGESAKKANRHRTASAYDSVFVADYHAVQRYQRTVRRWIGAGACAIGAPVVDGLSATTEPSPRPIRTLVYAPTWEGTGPNADYSSIDVVGPALIEALPTLTARGVDVILRPHPGTGKRRPDLKGIVKALLAAGAVRSRDKAADLTRADLLISDVSGITSEFLFTRKPNLLPITTTLVEVMHNEARIRREYPWVDAWYPDREPLLDRLAALESADPQAEAREAAAKRQYRGHRTVDDAARTFDLALACARRRSSLLPVRLRFELLQRLGGLRRAR